ncbi:Dph6-related ATP pyrophosphatase [Planococcus lenghuensis]|uniref:Adenosine nucleotide hydrolase n=1 Tax=Planococcus lenghuensis TaxID=2213202 RepID=A0A1Q2KUZ4_9BACL|nr:diphthine--ammonia ligase [Planococcus lenghuensis]AQQ52030.1 adenosine nucleotide hydrolase [Planococcus lenghuensis]
MQRAFIVSWSGGKDSALAYYRAVMEGHVPLALLTMFEEDGERSRSHGLPLEVLEAQAAHMGLPLAVGKASWSNYEEEFKKKLKAFREQGIEMGVYGDIDLEDHKQWVENVSEAAGMEAYHPLWQEPRLALLEQLLEEEFEAVITVVDTTRMSEKYLGKTLTAELIKELESLGIDACGEEGEFHTVIVDGPIFVERVPLMFGDVLTVGNHRMLDVKLQTEE